jgi:hypothetical protein
MCLECFKSYGIVRLNDRMFIEDKDLDYSLPCLGEYLTKNKGVGLWCSMPLSTIFQLNRMIVMDLAGREWPDSLPAETTNLVAHVTHFDDFVI